MALSVFSPPVREWFESAFEAPTPAQALAWPAIASGEHVLLSAPTGSGKTLAAFLWALDRLHTEGCLRDGMDPGSEPAPPGSEPAPPGSEPAPPEGEPRRVRGGTRLVYVSPLKALSYDIERNLRAPLRGIGAGELRVAIRTGDTPQRERAAMARQPPEILITTPESLYLILTSGAREMLSSVEAVIVDEIHAVAATKRGSHLALTLERLERQGGPGRGIQRIGLSATQTPLEEVGRFLVGPGREVRIVDAGASRPLDLRIHVPVESMTDASQQAGEASQNAGNGAGPQPGNGAPESSPEPPFPERGIWPAIYPELLGLVREHRSTIVFVNNRRAAERLALRLNELAEAEIARAHHGSLAHEERSTVEEMLKAGQLPCLVATSSLELGIDMGAVDLVIQVESPKSVARGLQRIGRAGHGVGEVSRGRVFPKFRADLLECAVVCRLMREGRIEPTVVPRNALDVLAQQIVAIAAAEEDPGIAVDELFELVRRTYSYAELPRSLFEGVLDMLDGRYPSREFAELRPRIVWDRLAGTIRPRRGARQLAVANAGTIPDRGLYTVVLPDGRRVGELDEEMVYEARAGQTFLLGASAWRIEEIGRDRVIVTPAPGAPGAVPFWKGDSVGRPKELGEQIGCFSRWAVQQDPGTLEREYDLDERAARNLLTFLREQQAATGVLPSERTIVLERFRDEIGDWRLCVLSPYGARVHAAWGLALSHRIRERFGLESDAIWSDDGIIVHLPDADASEDGSPEASEALRAPPSLTELVLSEPEEVEQEILAELGSSALFGARFRENAARALLIPRAYPGRRTPLWQQRLKAQSLLEVARRYESFPIVLETYRECLRDVLDVPGLVALLRSLHTRERSLVEVETQTASPFASSLLFDFLATYMYEGDAPTAERRAAALSLDRDLLRELLGQEELRDLIDPGALGQVEEDLQHRSAQTRATTRDTLHDVLRRVGELSRAEIQERVLEGIDARGLLEGLLADRRAIAVRVAGRERFIAADEAGLYRDALGVAPPGGLPAAYLERVDEPLRMIVARYARTHGPFTTAEASSRYGVDVGPSLRELERAGGIVRGELRPRGGVRPGGAPPGGAEGSLETSPTGEREWCDLEILRRLRRASLAALRREIEPTEPRALAAFLPSWQGVDRWPAREHQSPGGGETAAGMDRLREVLLPLQGLALPVEVWERDVLPRRTGHYSPSWLDALCSSGELVWVGGGSLGRSSGRVALYFREDAPLLGPPPLRRGTAPSAGQPAALRGVTAPAAPGHSAALRRATAPAAAGHPKALDEEPHVLVRSRLAAGPSFFGEMLGELGLSPEVLREAIWDLVWAGEITNDSFSPLRAPRLTVASSTGRASRDIPSRGFAARGAAARAMSARGSRRFRPGARGSAAGAAQVQGRWSLTAPLFDPAQAVALSDRERRRTLAELLLERYGLVTREQVLAEGIPGGFAMLYEGFAELEMIGTCRRGYFIEGLGGAQFALPGAVERLREIRTEGRAPGEHLTLVIAASDPAQPYGAALPWPRPSREGRRLARVAGAYVVLVDAQPVLYVERGGRGVQSFGESPEGLLAVALRALAEAVRSRQVGRLALESLDGQPLLGSALEALLMELGFRSGPRRLTLSV